MKIVHCSVCFESWPLSASTKSLKASEFICVRCKKDKQFPNNFSKENKMMPSELPNPLKNVTQVEEILVSTAFPVMQIYTKPRGGQLAYKGHVIILPNDVLQIF